MVLTVSAGPTRDPKVTRRQPKRDKGAPRRSAETKGNNKEGRKEPRSPPRSPMAPKRDLHGKVIVYANSPCAAVFVGVYEPYIPGAFEHVISFA
jgi:hypothetical protein